MTRIVEIEDRKPMMIDPSEHEDTLWICRCGLSQEWPLCDGSHKQARNEEDDKLYAYHRDEPGGALKREVVDTPPNAQPRP